MDEVRVTLDAMNPCELLDAPSEVFIRREADFARGYAQVELRGTPEAIADFVEEHWGVEELERLQEEGDLP